MGAKDLPNILSVLRILMVAPVVLGLLDERYGLALFIFLLAGASDGLDGLLAKRYGWSSRLGSILDPLADKALLVCCYATLGWMGHIPLWLVLAVVARDVVILLGAITYHIVLGRYEMEPRWLSKTNTVVQITFVLVVIASLAFWPLQPWLMTSLVYIVLLTTVLSGVEYVWIWGRRAREQWLARSGNDRG